jgi:hypothetical protein
MSVNPWKAPAEIIELVEKVKSRFHLPRLAESSIVVAIEDSKPFLRNKLNLGKVSKFNALAKLWQGQAHDFCISIPSDLWHSILKGEQREAYLDLQLTRCGVEYIAETVEENGKKKPVKDEWGRIQYTQEIKRDDEGAPKWKVLPLDLDVLTSNMRRYGLWHDDLLELKNVVIAAQNGDGDGA